MNFNNSFLLLLSLVTILLMMAFTSLSLITATTTTIQNTLWVLSKKSGTIPNTQNVPLFENVSLILSSPFPKQNSLSYLMFCFDTNYSFEVPMNLSSPPFANASSVTWQEPTHLNFQNMFLGLEYVTGETSETMHATSTLSPITNSSRIEISMRRSMSSSQSKGTVIEFIWMALNDTILGSSSSSSSGGGEPALVLEWSRNFFWNPTNNNYFPTTWVFEKASKTQSIDPNLFPCIFNNNHHQSDANTDPKNTNTNDIPQRNQQPNSNRKKRYPSRSDILQLHTQKQREQQKQQTVHHHDHHLTTEEQRHLTRYNQHKQAALYPSLPHPHKQMKQRQLSENETSYVLYINNTWNITAGGLDANAFLLALQGLVNRERAVLYFIYPPSWGWTDTLSIFDFYNKTGGDVGLKFVTLRHLDDVIDVFASTTPNAVLWTKNCREALLAGWSMAGVHDAFLLEETDTTLLNALNARRAKNNINLPPLTIVEKLTAPFYTDMKMNRTLASSHLASKIWQNVSKDYIISIGGVQNEMIHPGVADFIVNQKTFAHDLSTNKEGQPDQYELIRSLLSRMNTDGLRDKTRNVLWMGWHQYGYDTEHSQTRLVSEMKMAVEGLNTQPNFSFNHAVKVPADWKFQPNRMQAPSKPQENAIYMSLVQTDGVGLGAWAKPGRGLEKYNWEITLCDLYLQPAVVRYLYLNSTKNDYFVGALSGLGYQYSKVVPRDFLPFSLAKAQTAMNTLGLSTMIIFDASSCYQEYTTTSDTNLNQSLVNDYCKFMPQSQTFINGYTNANDFSVCPASSSSSSSSSILSSINNKNKNSENVNVRLGPGAFLSFDYYVDMSRNVQDIITDMLQLFAANPVRPYYISLHVREWNTEQKMAILIEELRKAMAKQSNGNKGATQLEIVTADVLGELAGKYPTFRQHFSE